MGGYHVPSGLVERQATGLELIRWVQIQWCGKDRGASNDGQIKLAGWMMAHPVAASLMRLRTPVLERILTGEVLPTDETAEMIAEETEAAVLPEHWGTVRRSAVVPVDGDDMPAPIHNGRLGERCHGPLFRTVRDPDGCTVLVGPGVSLVLDRFHLAAAYEALGVACAEQEATR